MAHLQTTWSNERYQTVNRHVTEVIKRSEVKEALILLLASMWMPEWLNELHTCIRQVDGEKRGKATRRECLKRIRNDVGPENLSQSPIKARNYILQRRYYRTWCIVSSVILVVDLFLAVLCTRSMMQGSSDALTTVDKISLMLWVVSALLMCVTLMNVQYYFKYKGNKASDFVGRGWIDALKKYEQLGLIRKIVDELVRSHDDTYGFIERAKAGASSADDKQRIRDAFLGILDSFAQQCLIRQEDVNAEPEEDGPSAKDFSLALSLSSYFGVVGTQEGIRTNAIRSAQSYLHAQRRVKTSDEEGDDEIRCTKDNTTILLFELPSEKRTKPQSMWNGPPPKDAA